MSLGRRVSRRDSRVRIWVLFENIFSNRTSTSILKEAISISLGRLNFITIGLIFIESSENIGYAIKNVGLLKTSQNKVWVYFTYLWLKSSLGREFVFESNCWLS
jgi:hypothetical protein